MADRIDLDAKIDQLLREVGFAPPEEIHAALLQMAQTEGGGLGVRLADIQFRRQVIDENDRAAALFTAAYLETRLADTLRLFLVPDSAIVDGLLKGTGGIATFSARIDLVYLLGLVTKRQRRDLHLIRGIRNDFAHHPEPMDFSNGSVSSRCLHLDAPSAESSRARFIQCSMTILATLNVACEELSNNSRIRCTERVRQEAMQGKQSLDDGVLLLLETIKHKRP